MDELIYTCQEEYCKVYNFVKKFRIYASTSAVAAHCLSPKFPFSSGNKTKSEGVSLENTLSREKYLAFVLQIKNCITGYISQLDALCSGISSVTKLVFSPMIGHKIFTVIPYIPIQHSLQVLLLSHVSFGN